MYRKLCNHVMVLIVLSCVPAASKTPEVHCHSPWTHHTWLPFVPCTLIHKICAPPSLPKPSSTVSQLIWIRSKTWPLIVSDFNSLKYLLILCQLQSKVQYLILYFLFLCQLSKLVHDWGNSSLDKQCFKRFYSFKYSINLYSTPFQFLNVHNSISGILGVSQGLQTFCLSSIAGPDMQL